MLGVTTRGYIFDIDGTLVLSNAAHAAAWAPSFARAGFFDVTPAVVRPFVGMGGEQLVASIKPKLPPTIKHEIIHNHGRIFRQDYLHKITPAPGCKELLLDLEHQGCVLGVATSAGADELAAILAVAGIDDILRLRVCADDVERAKPAPDVVTAALQKMALAPEETLMVADTPYDITAAHGAGVRIIALRCGGWDDRSLAQADAIFDDPAQLAARLDKYYGVVGVIARLA